MPYDAYGLRRQPRFHLLPNRDQQVLTVADRLVEHLCHRTVAVTARSAAVRSFAVNTMIGNRRCPSRPTECVEEFEAVHVGHQQIENDERGTAFRDATQPDSPVLRLEDGPPLALQHLLRQAPHGRIVVDDEHRRRWSGITQLPSQRRSESARIDRLRQVVRRAQRVSCPAVVGHRDHHDGNVGELGIRFERRQHRPAVHARHHDVERDCCRTHAARQREPSSPVDAITTRMPSFASNRVIRSCTIGIVVDHEHCICTADPAVSSAEPSPASAPRLRRRR